MFFIFSCIELLTHIDISNYLRIDRRLFRGEPAVFLYSLGNNPYQLPTINPIKAMIIDTAFRNLSRSWLYLPSL